MSKTCPTCQTTFERLQNRQRFCSVKCRAKDQQAKFHARHRDRRNAKNSAYYYANHAEQIHYRRAHYLVYKEKVQNARLTSPWLSLLKGAKNRATKKAIHFSLSVDWARKRWTGFCELSGLPFVLGKKGHGGAIFSPSIDRKKPKLGYTENNCRFVLHALNAFKMDGSEEDMIAIALAFLKKQDLK